MELIFNELSLASSAPDRDIGHRWMKNLSETIQAGVDRGIDPVLRTCGDFWSTDLAPDYKLANWSYDPTVDRDLKRYIMGVAGKAPFIEALHRVEEDKTSSLAEFTHNGKSVLGLGLSALRDHPAVSMSVKPWQDTIVMVHEYKETAEGLKEKEMAVRHWHDCASVKDRESYNWLRKRHGDEILSGPDLLKRKAVLHRLEFTPRAMKQLESLKGNEKPFPHVVQHIIALHFQALDWKGGPFELGYPYPCSEETKATMQQYGHYRVIRCADGLDRTFSWHSKINVDAWRIHFLKMEGRQVLIGHIGRHLPTVGDPH